LRLVLASLAILGGIALVLLNKAKITPPMATLQAVDPEQ
jgi:hypothetical protein